MVIWPIETGVMVTDHGSGRRQGNSTLIIEQMFVVNQVILVMSFYVRMPEIILIRMQVKPPTPYEELTGQAPKGHGAGRRWKPA
jgi:hypothetical protein